RLDAGLLSEMVAAGLFRLCVPAALGGLEAPVAELVGAVEELARGDAAPAWCVAVNATSGLVAAYLPEAAAREIYGPPELVVGGVFAPRGRAVRRERGFAVSGRWPFASGAHHCAWLMGGCIVLGAGGEPERLGVSGMPDVRLMLA